MHLSKTLYLSCFMLEIKRHGFMGENMPGFMGENKTSVQFYKIMLTFSFRPGNLERCLSDPSVTTRCADKRLVDPAFS